MSKLFGTNVQIAPLQQTRIQPAGIPGSTFVRPQERQVGGNLNALASALGGLNSALLNYAAVKDAVEDDPQSRENREWIGRRQQMSLDQLREEAKNGTPDGIRVREDALNVMLGERANDDFRKAWLEFYNTGFDRSSGNAAGEYERLRQTYAEGLPNDIAKGNFYRLTKDHFSAWMEKDTEDRVSYAKQQLNTTIVDGFRNSIDDAAREGKTPQEIAAMIFTKSAANRDFLGLSGQEQNDTIFRVAEEYALQGNEEVARALLEGTRTGSDGRTVPALTKIAGYTDKALKLLDQAAEVRRKKARETGLSEFMTDDELVRSGAFTAAEAEKRKGSSLYTDAELASMVDQSSGYRLAAETRHANEQRRLQLSAESERQEDRVYAQAFGAMERMGGINDLKDVEIAAPSGEGTKRIAKQTIVDRVVDMKEEAFRRMQEDLIAGGASEEDARRQVNRARTDWYAGNKIVNTGWQNTLNGFAGRATLDTLLQKGEVSAYLKDSARLYRDLKAVNPAYLSTVLTDPKSKEFLETYDNALSARRMPEDEALVYAAQRAAMPEGLKAKDMIKIEDADRLARRMLKDLEVDLRGPDYLHVMGRISSLSRSGFTDAEIKNALADELKNTAIPIHGVLVANHRDLPDDFPALIEEALKRHFENYAGEYPGIPDPSDLYVVADGAESRWYVASKSLGGWPVKPQVQITPAILSGIAAEKAAAEDEKIRALAKAKEADRAALKQQHDEEIAAERATIERWRRQTGPLSQAIARKLQQKLDDRLAREAGFVKNEQDAVTEALKKNVVGDGAVALKAYSDWLNFITPSVTINGKTVVKGGY